MKNISTRLKEAVKKLANTISSGMEISWKASKIYTFVRVFFQTLLPFSAIISSFIFKKLIDLMTTENPDFLSCILLLCIGTVSTILFMVLKKILAYIESMHELLLEKYVSEFLMKKSVEADLEMFDNSEFYDKFSVLQQDLNQIVQTLWYIINAISSFISIFSVFAILLNFNIVCAIIIIISSIPSAIVTQHYIKVIYGLNLDQTNGNRQKYYLYYIATNKEYAQDIKLFGIGNYIIKKYLTLWQSLFIQRRKTSRNKTIAICILELLPEISIFIITVYLILQIINKQYSLGDYVLFSGLFLQLSAYVNSLINNIMQIYDKKIRVENLTDIIQIPAKIKTGDQSIEKIEKIEFENVCFSYPGTNKVILDNINFSVDKNMHVAIVGLNGSGKSTILKLLLRFYDVDKGEILINGKNIKKYVLTELRTCFSVYFQNTLNYAFTIRENISLSEVCSGRAISDEKIMNALYASGSTNLINSSSKGLDTFLTHLFDNNGAVLSVGENQKIALARTFMRDCSVLILDEPSSFLDPEAEDFLFQTFKNLVIGGISIYVCHKLSYIDSSDYVIVMENGKIVEKGFKLELINKKSRFYELYNFQASKFENCR